MLCISSKSRPLIMSIDGTLQIAGGPYKRRHDFLPQLHNI
jgi:hypothetical protein